MGGKLRWDILWKSGEKPYISTLLEQKKRTTILSTTWFLFGGSDLIRTDDTPGMKVKPDVNYVQ